MVNADDYICLMKFYNHHGNYCIRELGNEKDGNTERVSIEDTPFRSAIYEQKAIFYGFLGDRIIKKYS